MKTLFITLFGLSLVSTAHADLQSISCYMNDLKQAQGMDNITVTRDEKGIYDLYFESFSSQKKPLHLFNLKITTLADGKLVQISGHAPGGSNEYGVPPRARVVLQLTDETSGKKAVGVVKEQYLHVGIPFTSIKAECDPTWAKK